MNYHDAWIKLIWERDQVYLYLLIGGCVALMWYRFLLYRYYRLALGGAACVIGAALVWGVVR